MSSDMAKEELAEVLGLSARLRLQLDARELGDAVDEAGDLGAEAALDVGKGGKRILDRVVEEGRHDGIVVELVARQDARDFEGMGEVGVARLALLAAVRLHREDVGAVQLVLVRVGIVGLDPLDQLVLTDHRTRAPGPGGAG